ncbi:hypothetical protein PG997_001541 [Apiospora hydei]|uniref:EthD domain-containing protein n=1 Tax=Apiospora hydei TaxID=1337664 RepID=A0ABR1XDV7_9PEZI
MAKPERVLRLAGSYRRRQGISEEEFHDYLSHRHGVECAKIHEKYGILKYQMAFNTTSTRALADSMKLPYPVSTHDLEIEYYFRDVASLLAVSADAGFRALHVECEPYVDLAATTVTLTWIEVYLEDGRLVNVDQEGRSAQLSFGELADVGVAEGPVAKYY